MKNVYLNIMEKALSAYTPQGIEDYIREVETEGLTEHGFPRLGVNIGILLAYGRAEGYMDTFIRILDICCDQIPRKKAANDFSVLEICNCLMLLEKQKTVDPALLQKWKAQIASIDPWECYTRVYQKDGGMTNNWALFAAVSEYTRGICCGIDTGAFVDHQLPSQLVNLDDSGMFRDHPPYGNHVVYDLVPRTLFSYLLWVGYQGKYAGQIRQALEDTADITMKMQSVTGELAFGGRSNEFVHNEAWISAYCELEAVRFAREGNLEKAGQLRAAARFATQTTEWYLALDPISHIKNRYDISSKIGCEGYGYFNKYMISVASIIHLALLAVDESIPTTQAPADRGGYLLNLPGDFHKVFLNNGEYFLEIDTLADFDYDASGLGRVHKRGVPSKLCLSVPFCKKPKYVLEDKNPTSMSLCGYAQVGESLLLGAERYAKHTLIGEQVTEELVSATFGVRLSREITLTQRYQLSDQGVDITLSGYDQVGFMVPVFDFDGKNTTAVTLEENAITVSYLGATCRYTFHGKILGEPRYYYNRNGRYRVYRVASPDLHITMQEAQNGV